MLKKVSYSNINILKSKMVLISPPWVRISRFRKFYENAVQANFLIYNFLTTNIIENVKCMWTFLQGVLDIVQYCEINICFSLKLLHSAVQRCGIYGKDQYICQSQSLFLGRGSGERHIGKPATKEVKSKEIKIKQLSNFSSTTKYLHFFAFFLPKNSYQNTTC